MRKSVRYFLALCLLAIVAAVSLISCKPQEKPKIQRKVVAVITFVEHPVLNTIENSFRTRLDELTRPKGVDYIPTNGQGNIDNLPSLSRQVLAKKPDIIVTISTPVAKALMTEADNSQRIVYTFVTNPENLGDQLTRTNSTGLSDAVNYAANINLIMKTFGEKVTIGMLYNPNELNSVYGIQTVESLLKGSSAKLVKIPIQNETEVPNAVIQLSSRVNVIYVGGDNTVVGAVPTILTNALGKRIPVFASDSGSIEKGAIAGVSVDYEKLGRQTADVVYDVLNGKEPRMIPRITLPGDILIVNKKSASLWKFNVPSWMLSEANKTIDEPK